jgi:Lipopolysaccharide-assembly, LptC-related
MRSFRNLLFTAILAGIVGAAAFHWYRRSAGGETAEVKKAAPAAVTSAKSAKPPEAAAEPGAAPKTSAPKKAGKDTAANGKPDKENERMHDIPVSADHPAKGLKIPYFDNEGKLQMNFVIGIATRLDADHIDMSDMQVETFDEREQHEMYIDLPTSVLDLNTSVISTQKHVTIRREDFILTGQTMEFNTKTKQGSLGGSVKMLIYNLDNSNPQPASETPAPAQSAASATPPPASESNAP